MSADMLPVPPPHRIGSCVTCKGDVEQTLACEDPPIYIPKFCSSACEETRLEEQQKFLGRIADATNEHLLKNRLADANLSREAARGDLSFDNAGERYEKARKGGAGVTIERYREVATAVRDFISVPPLLRVNGVATIAYIYGPEGTGKSVLAEIAVAHVVLKRENKAVFTPFMDFISDVRSAFEIDGKTEARVLDTYYTAELVAIDDITRRLTPTNWEMETLLRVVDQRLRMRRPTIITANYDISGLFKLWSNADDERVTKLVRLLCDRLSDTHNAISLPMVGRSLRREG